MRSAEQRCPALWKLEAMMSRTACSGRAVESTIIALRPPVSAISGARGSRFSAMERLMICATSVEPVKQTPATRGSEVSGAPTAGPSPGRSWIAALGTPASCINPTARAAINGVCSAGLAITALPAASAAEIWPVKIARGKFHGLMQTIGPRGPSWPSSRSASAA